MKLGTVVGHITSTINHPFYDGKKLLIVDQHSSDGKLSGNLLVAIDSRDAGVGQQVLVIDEGNSARQIVDDSKAPLRSIIIGIVDEVATHTSK